MNKEELIEELWWDLRSVGYIPSDDDVGDLLMKAYESGLNDERNDPYDY
jgi:hypothetical protein